MSSSDKVIKFQHFKMRKGAYALYCLNGWMESRGLNMRHLVKTGYTVAECRAVCKEPNAELEELISFIEDNDLWDIDSNLTIQKGFPYSVK